MPLIKEFKLLTPAERGLWRFPMMWLSALAIALVPLLYATIYLGSTLDPYGNLAALPVGLVNSDAGAVARGEQRNLGAETVKQLMQDQRFEYVNLPHPGRRRGRRAARPGLLCAEHSPRL